QRVLILGASKRVWEEEHEDGESRRDHENSFFKPSWVPEPSRRYADRHDHGREGIEGDVVLFEEGSDEGEATEKGEGREKDREFFVAKDTKCSFPEFLVRPEPFP